MISRGEDARLDASGPRTAQPARHTRGRAVRASPSAGLRSRVHVGSLPFASIAWGVPCASIALGVRVVAEHAPPACAGGSVGVLGQPMQRERDCPWAMGDSRVEKIRGSCQWIGFGGRFGGGLSYCKHYAGPKRQKRCGYRV
eukprot:scaffold20282_cov152-Isochrysis_galbana.AAC.1